MLKNDLMATNGYDNDFFHRVTINTFSSAIMRSCLVFPPNVIPIPSSSLSLSLSVTASLLNHKTFKIPNMNSLVRTLGISNSFQELSCSNKIDYGKIHYDKYTLVRFPLRLSSTALSNKGLSN